MYQLGYLTMGAQGEGDVEGEYEEYEGNSRYEEEETVDEEKRKQSEAEGEALCTKLIQLTYSTAVKISTCVSLSTIVDFASLREAWRYYSMADQAGFAVAATAMAMMELQVGVEAEGFVSKFVDACMSEMSSRRRTDLIYGK